MAVPLTGKVAIVTGASSGIGKAAAEALANHGAAVCGVGRTIGEGGGPERSYNRRQVDLTRDDDVRRFSAYIEHEYGRVDVLIHSAAMLAIGPLSDAPIQQFDEMYQVNVRGALTITQHLLHLLRSSRGHVVFLNSSLGLAGKKDLGYYSSTKHALKGLADSLREEVNPYGVRVTTVYVGRTATPMQAHLHRWEGRQYEPETLLQPADVAATLLSVLSMPPTAEITDVTIRPMRNVNAETRRSTTVSGAHSS
jgi:NAD(P)-dependent dehydrogenase (short-subunit alcohol dehydrogenase family)